MSICTCCKKESEDVIERKDVYAFNFLKKTILRLMCGDCYRAEFDAVYDAIMEDS